MFSSLLSRTLGKVKIRGCLHKVFGSLCKTICLSTSNNRLSFSAAAASQKQAGESQRRTTPLIVVTSVFAQTDSESEELLKCGVRPFWALQELTITTVSFHIS